MAFYTDDPVMDAERYIAEQDAEIEKLPECCECGCKIQDEHCYEINGEYICEECLKDNHRKNVEDLI
jgi:hypothetical protein